MIVYQLDPTGDPKPEIAGELAEAVAEFTTPLCLPNLDAGTCAVDDDGKVFQLRCRDIAVRVDGTGDYFIDSASMGLGLQVFAASEDSIVPSCNGEAVPTSVYQSVSQLENAGGWDTVPYKTPLKTFDYALVLEHPAVGPETPTRALYVSTEDGLLTFDLNVSATPVQDQEPHWLGVQALLLAGFPNDANGHGGRIIALQHDSYNVLSLDGTPLQPTPVEDGCVIPLLETQRTIGLAVEDGGLGAGDERWLYTTVGGANGDLLAVWNLGTSAAPVTPVAPEATYTVSNGKRLGFIATRRVVGDEHVVYVSYSEENPGVCGAMMCGPGENAGGILTFEVARPAGTAAISLVDTDCTVCSSDEGFAPAASTTGCDPLGKPSVSSLQPTLDLSRERLYCGWTGAAMAMYDVSTPDDPLLLATRFFETPERPVEPTPIHAIPGYSDSGAQEDYVYIPLMHQGVGILNAYDDEMFASGPMPIMETPLQAFFAALDPFADPGERRALYVPIGRGGLVHMTLSF